MLSRIISQANCRKLHLALLAGGLGIFLVAVLTIVLSLVSLDNYNRNVDSRAQSRNVLLSAKDLEASLRDVETASWRYAFSGDETFLDWHAAAVGDIAVRLANLAALTRDTDYQESRLTELQTLIPEALGHLRAAIEARHAEGGTAGAIPHLSSPEHRAAIDRGHVVLGEVTTEENRQIAALTEDTDRLAKTMAFSVSLLAVVNLGLLGVLALYLRRRSHEAMLRRSNEAKDQFIGLVSHELRNPIGTISSAASILQRRGDALSAAEREDLLRGISDDAGRLERRVSNMLLVARLEDPEADFEPLLLQRLIPRVVELHRRRFPAREIVIQVDDDLPLVNGDASYFEQVLLNFLGNAEKYGHSTAPIEVEAREEDDGVRVAVLDRGEGIEPSVAEQLFQPFFRTDSARRKASGAGLGLAVCRRLVEMQHGRTWAAARPGGGSVFAFTLPRAGGLDEDPAVELVASSA